MIKMNLLINMANQYVSERNWWQFHNPKNESLNIITEVGELAELFVAPPGVTELQAKISDEIADVLFGVLLFTKATQTNISQKISLMINKQVCLQDEMASYSEISALVLANLDVFELTHLKAPDQIVLSLTWQATKLTDLFTWCTPEESIKIMQIHLLSVQITIAKIMVHLIYLADLLKVDLDFEFVRKMAKNNDKYPVALAQGHDYEKIKNIARNNKKQ